MISTRSLVTLLLSIVVIACLYQLTQAEADVDGQERSFLGGKLFGSNSKYTSPLRGDKKIKGFINPFTIINRFLAYIFSIVTFPIRYPIRIVANLLASIGLLLLGCRVIPDLSCPERIRAMVPEFIDTFQEEMEFFATFVDDAGKE